MYVCVCVLAVELLHACERKSTLPAHVGRCRRRRRRSVYVRKSVTNILSQVALSVNALSRIVCLCALALCSCVCCALLLSSLGTGCGRCCLATRCCRTLCAYLAASVWLEQENESVKSGTSAQLSLSLYLWSMWLERAAAKHGDVRRQRRTGIGLAWPYVWSPLRRAAICDWASWPAPLCPCLSFDIAPSSSPAMLSSSGTVD